MIDTLIQAHNIEAIWSTVDTGTSRDKDITKRANRYALSWKASMRPSRITGGDDYCCPV